jgi:TetR/AcrR family transcriptional repressor of nem operon
MGRPQEFNTDDAVEAAMTVFWSRGPHCTSVDDLAAATGLARSSLYNAFGGKQALLELAIQRYVNHQVLRLQNVLDAPTLKQALEKLFSSAVNDNYGGRGCLLVNCASSLLQVDEGEKVFLRQGFERLFAIVEARMRRAQQAKEMPQSINPVDAATLVCASLSGLRVFHKTAMGKTRLKGAADLAVKALLQQLT